MPLEPRTRQILDLLTAALPRDPANLKPAELRNAYRKLVAARQGTHVARVEDRTVPGPAGQIPVRFYAPSERPTLPILVYFHGGGFVVCDLDTHDSTCRLLAKEVGCAVLSVDYRLAPEARFPAAAEDCYAATYWAGAHAGQLGCDTDRIAVAGDSAGGNLAAVVAQLARVRSGPRLAHQLLIYPVTDYAFDTPSYRDNAEGYFLTRDMMRWFWGHYLERPEDGDDPAASPLRAKALAGLPPATVITAEYDPLRDEGEAYAARLAEAGVDTELRRYEGMFHGFFAMAEILDGAKQSVEFAASRLRAAFQV